MGNISYQKGSKHTFREMVNIIGNNAYFYHAYSDMKAHLEKHGIDLNKEQIFVGKQLSFNSKKEQFEDEHSGLANRFVKGICEYRLNN